MSAQHDLSGLTQSSLSLAWDTTWRQRDRPWFWGLTVLADFIAALTIVIVNQERLTELELVALGAGGAASATAGAAAVLFLLNLIAAPYRQRNEARRRLVAIISVPSVSLEPIADGGLAYLRVTNQGSPGVFRANMLSEFGREFHLGWSEDFADTNPRDKRLLTGESGRLLVAVLRDGFEAKDYGYPGYLMMFFEADQDEHRSMHSARDGERGSYRITVLSEHERPVSIDLVLGADIREASWDPLKQEGEVVLHQGLFTPAEGKD